MIEYLYGSKSWGVSNYTHELKQHMVDTHGVSIQSRSVGGVHVLSHMDRTQLREHLLRCVSPVSTQNVLHVQHDTLMFRGAGDEIDEMDNMCWFLDLMNQRYSRVIITLHSCVKFQKPGWLRQPITRAMSDILSRQWRKQVIPTFNRCVVLVHSMPHVRLLNSQGCHTARLFVHPTNRHSGSQTPDTQHVRVVVPGQLVDRKCVGRAIETCTRMPGSTLTLDTSNRALFEHYKNYAVTRHVQIEPIQWSLNTHEYLEQLKQHDVALVVYNDDVPLSGSIIDSLRCGLIVGCSDTPSFQWFGDEYQCVFSHGNDLQLGDLIMDQLRDPVTRARTAWHADNYFATSHQSACQLLDVYQGEAPQSDINVARKSRSKPVTAVSRQVTHLPTYMTHTSACVDLKNVCGLLHVEHQHRQDVTLLSSEWSGLLHGPFMSTTNTLNKLTADSMITQGVFDKCVSLQVTNTRLQQLIEPHVSCVVDVLKLENFPPDTVFDVDQFMSQSTRVLLHDGWWCRNFNSFGKIKLTDKWCKQLRVDKQQPTRELLDMSDVDPRDVHLTTATNNCACCFIDQTTDDVVDDHMLWCVSTYTPVLIRRNATTEEYLGSDYVLMFDDIGEASDLLTDRNIKLAHEQLKR